MDRDPLGSGQNILSLDICSTAGSQVEQDVKDLTQELKEVREDRDYWADRYYELLDEIGGVWPG
jgi:N-formylglutamate amidohydrolase